MLIEPWYLNFFNNMATVQFDHRLIAAVLAVVVPWFSIAVRRAPRRNTCEDGVDAASRGAGRADRAGHRDAVDSRCVAARGRASSRSALLFTATLATRHALR
jgi:hypothetical protein